MKRGYVQVYTGNGKGKTTAALGLALRAVGAGLRVLIVQFLKGQEYSEHNILKILPDVDIELYGRKTFVHEPTEEDKKLCQEGLKRIRQAFNEDYDVIILDEANVAIYLEVMDKDELIDVIKSKPKSVEIIVTGRYAPMELIEFADLVTEMKEIKHYYNQGVIARKGIEM